MSNKGSRGGGRVAAWRGAAGAEPRWTRRTRDPGRGHNGDMNLRELQAPIKRRYEEDPAAARITMTARSAPSDLSDPLHVAIAPDAVPGLTWRSGAHRGVGGTGDVACSGDLLMGALAACQEVTLRMVAAAMGVELEAVEVE